MYAKTIIMAVALSAVPGLLHAQFDFKIANRDVQVHSFASQGFAYSNVNNYMTMQTTSGSFAMTDGAVNISSQITDKFRVGAQVYVRNIGQIGKWHPELDWAVGAYKFKDWFGVRAGKVKTTLGLHNDTQDMEFLHTWAILPQSIYPLDLRASTIAHVGGDIFGDVALKKLGSISYTIYAGQRPQDPRGGYVLGLASIGLKMSSYGGWQQGQDLRWNTPVKGLMVGASLMNQHITGRGSLNLSTALDPFLIDMNVPDLSMEREHSNKNDYYQYYVQYARGGLRLEGEYRREYRNEWVGYYTPDMHPMFNFGAESDSRSWYGSASYRVSKRLELGAYGSWFFFDWRQDLTAPANHVRDTAVTTRFDLTGHWSLKLEGHFMNGYGRFDSIRGFYEQQNPRGLRPGTNMLVIRTGFNL
jgi:hypothetical protein